MISRLAQRLGVRQGEGAAVTRFIIVGIGATLVYLAVSLQLLRSGVAPQLANLLAFGAGLTVSYGGHYFFTYRSSSSHAKAGTRFAWVTAALVAACSMVQQFALWAGISPERAALIIAVLYPSFSFLLNHFWSFSRTWIGADGRGEH